MDIFKNVTNETFQRHSDTKNFPTKETLLKMSLLSVIRPNDFKFVG